MLTEPAAAPSSSTVLRGFEDGLGRRYSPASRNDKDAPLEILCFRHEITDVPSFEFALRERVGRLSDFNHPYYARIRKVDRLSDERGTVALMSDGAPGIRLIEMLTAVERGGPAVDLSTALYLVRQLVPAIAVLHEHAQVAHGAIAPERLFVTPAARLFIVEHVLGAALEQLKYSRERYWRELRVALPMAVGLPRFDERADLTQVGVVALSLILGRQLRDDEYPGQIEELVGSASSLTAEGEREPLPTELREWLRRILQLDVRNSFRTLFEAQTALEQLVSGDETYNADVLSLEGFLQRYHGSAKPASWGPKPIVPEVAARRSEPRIEPRVEPVVEPRVETRIEPVRPLIVEPSPIAETSAETSSYLSEESEQDSERDQVTHSEWTADTEPAVESEEWQPMTSSRSGIRAAGRLKWIAAGLVLMMATTGALYAARRHFSSASAATAVGTMTLNTNPPGAAVEVDGAPRGQTPISLSLTPGAHTLVVRGTGEPRTIPINIAAGAQMSQYIELPKAASAVGQLQVRTDPAGARITVDGIQFGKTPITIGELAPGEHNVKLESDSGAVTQNVTIEAGITASLMVPLAATTPGVPLSGWVSVNAPVVVELYEQGRLLGTSGIDRIMLPTGKHDIDLVSAPLDYRETRSIQVTPGKVSAISVTLPKGTVSINAVPWASVSIDGESVGDTPIGNFPIAIGPHEVVFRNTELGEQRRVITVSLRTPMRLSVDMTKK
jgi:PEGA domain